MKIFRNRSNVYRDLNIIGPDSIIGNIEKYNNGVLSDVEVSKVRLYLQDSGHKLLETLSDKKGHYSFRNLDLKNNIFFIISHDKTGVHNGVIADNIGGRNVDN